MTTLALACVGIYGLLSQAVLRRTGEIGLRMALGAMPGQILRMVVRKSVMLACLGITLGAGAAYLSGKLVAEMFFGVSPGDPLTYGAVATVLVATAILAALVPASRASRVEPVRALRSE